MVKDLGTLMITTRMKRFKYYDEQFKAFKGTGLENIRKRVGQISRQDIDAIKCWDTHQWGTYVIYPQNEVQNAVYEAPDHEDWQKFRVSLKGLTTQEKLYCLQDYSMQVFLNNWSSGNRASLRLLLIRQNNYIGALIRGGQLNSNLEVVR